MSAHLLERWEPENATFWASEGKAIATRNLWISIPALLLAFSVWMVWSVVVVNLPNIGFQFSTNQLFWLAAVPGLSGATLRIFYSFMVPILGGRLWTTISTASSMANISFFYPKSQQGTALGLNAGLGNVGVSVVQFTVPLVITIGVFGALGGEPQVWSKGEITKHMWLQNAGFFWVPFIVVATIAAWFGMNDLSTAKASFADQSVIFRRKHNWLMCWLYIGTFGSFIGYSAGFPLLIKTQFEGIDPTQYAFLGPLVGALIRPAGGWVSDRLGGARVTFWNFIVMALAVCGVLWFLPSGPSGGNFWGFFAMFMLLFLTTGIGNGSTFRMIPVIFRTQHERWSTGSSDADRAESVRNAGKESAAVLGFSSAMAAYGAFFIPKSYGTSISMTGGPEAALYLFIAFYLSCIVTTWWFYSRKNAEMPC